MVFLAHLHNMAVEVTTSGPPCALSFPIDLRRLSDCWGKERGVLLLVYGFLHPDSLQQRNWNTCHFTEPSFGLKSGWRKCSRINIECWNVLLVLVFFKKYNFVLTTDGHFEKRAWPVEGQGWWLVRFEKSIFY